MAFRVKQHRLGAGTTDCLFTKTPNVGGALTPILLVMHYTASGPNFNTAAYFSNANSKVSAHLVIKRDGSVTQCVAFNEVAWHAGRSQWACADGQSRVGINNFAIGIELENWGPLQPSATGWASWTGEAVDPSKVIKSRHKNGGPEIGWETFSTPQIEAAVDAAQIICATYNIREIVGHEDISPGRKTDPGPAFKMDSFVSRALGRHDDGDASFIVRSITGLNIRSGPGVEFSLVRSDPLPDGTRVLVHSAEGNYRFVSVLNVLGQPDYSGWVHANWLSAS